MTEPSGERRRKKRTRKRATESPAVESPYEHITVKLTALLAIAFGVVTAISVLPSPGGGGMYFVLLSVLPITAGGLLLYRSMRSGMASGRVGTPSVSIDPAEARIGDRIAVVVDLAPLRDVTVQRVRIELVGRDNFPRDMQGGEDRNAGRDMELHRDTRELAGRRLRRGKRATFEATFPAPKVWPSLGATATWKVCVHMAYADGPDWDGEYRVAVESPED